MASPYKLHIPPCVHNPPHPHHPPLALEKPLRIQIEGPLVAIKRLLPPADDLNNSSPPSWSWPTRAHVGQRKFPQPAGLDLAKLAYHAVYRQDPESIRVSQQDEAGAANTTTIDGGSDDNDDADVKILVVRDECLSWMSKNKIPPDSKRTFSPDPQAAPGPRPQVTSPVRGKEEIYYYGITFDNYFVPPNDPNPEVLQLNIIELETEPEPDDNDDNESGVGVAFAHKYLLFEVDPADYVGQKILAVPRCCQKRKGTTDRKRVNSSVLRRDGRKDEANQMFG